MKRRSVTVWNHPSLFFTLLPRMTKTTSIEWTDHTLNFWWGCTKISEACRHCYAADIDRRFGPKLDSGQAHWGESVPRMDRRAEAETELAALCKRFAKSGEQPPRIFVNSMSDWLDPEVPIAWLADLLVTLCKYPGPVYQLLTKRPAQFLPRLCEILELGGPAALIAEDWLAGDPPANFWIGTTVETQHRANQRVPDLIAIPAKVRFLSCEPLLGPIALSASLPINYQLSTLNSSIHWIIAGGESGTAKGVSASHPDWFRSLRDQCALAAIPFFFKQWGSWYPLSTTDGRQILPFGHYIPPSPSVKGYGFMKSGKAAAGRLLDGREWNHFPNNF